MDPTDADSAVIAFYNSLEIDRNEPFNPARLFRRLEGYLEFELVEELPENMRGCVWYCTTREIWVMQILAGLDPIEGREVTAHEFGELLLKFTPEMKPQPSVDGDPTNIAFERAADLIGMMFGCPDVITKRLFLMHGWSGINSIARQLRMPPEMVALRIANLTDTSVAVVRPDNTVVRAGPWNVQPFDEELVQEAQNSKFRAGVSRLVVR